MLELRWLLELRMQQYGQAAVTLARVCRAEGGDAQAFAAAQRAACLAKLAVLADQEGGLASMPPKVSLTCDIRAPVQLGLVPLQRVLVASCGFQVMKVCRVCGRHGSPLYNALFGPEPQGKVCVNRRLNTTLTRQTRASAC